MLIILKNKDTLKLDDFIFKCSIGKSGLNSKKKEGDMTTPRGEFYLGTLYYRADRVKKPETKLHTRVIKKNMVWCDNPKSSYYNKETVISADTKYEKLFKKNDTYNYLIVINYNTKKTVPYQGSAIFIHLTKNYKKTAGCITLKEKDFLILAKLISKSTKIKII